MPTISLSDDATKSLVKTEICLYLVMKLTSWTSHDESIDVRTENTSCHFISGFLMALLAQDFVHRVETQCHSLRDSCRVRQVA